MYPSAGHVITGNLNVIPDARVRNIISKGPKYRFPSNIDFAKCRREIAASLNDFSNRWCKRENVEPDALKEWKINIFLSCVCYVLCTSVYMCFVVTCWERADLLALVCGVYCEFVTFPLVSWVRCGT